MKDKFFYIRTNYPYMSNWVSLDQYGKNLYVSIGEDWEKILILIFK